MQIRESNFFTTQLPNSDRYSLDNKSNNQSLDLQPKKRNPEIRIRQAKSQAKKVVNIYNNQLKEYIKIKNSLQKNNGKTQKLREEFVKLYGSKKQKYAHKTMLEKKRQNDEDFRHESINRVRTLKMNKDVGLMYTRNQCEMFANELKEENKKFSIDFKKRLRLKRHEELQESREKYLQIKQGESEFLLRKKNMSAMMSTRAYHNYLLKVNKEMQILDGYKTLLTRFNELPSIQFVNNSDIDEFNKTFFATTKNSFS